MDGVAASGVLDVGAQNFQGTRNSGVACRRQAMGILI